MLLKVRGPGTSINWHAVGDHYECKYSVGASRMAQVGAGCSNRYATCTWAEHGSHGAQVQVALVTRKTTTVVHPFLLHVVRNQLKLWQGWGTSAVERVAYG